MKKIYLLLISQLLYFTACDLDKIPETNYTDPTFWKSEKDVRAACNRMYEQLRGFTYMNNTWHDSRSDELVGTSANGVSAGSRTVPITSDNDWSHPYDRIFTANNILDKAKNAPIEEAILNRYLGEAHFFRAYNYFQLVKLYGDTPLILQSFDDPEDPVLYSGRTPREEVIQQCYQDLEFAVQWLPSISSLSSDDWGRVMRSAALGMIVRIGLYEGTYCKYHNLSSDYKAHLKKSMDAAELLAKEGHDLFPDFEKLFTFDGEGPDNKENVMVKVYGPNGAGTTTHGHSRTMENGVSVTRNIVDLFLYSDGLPREKSPLRIFPESSFNDPLENRDPRLKMTIFSLGEEAFKGEYMPFTNQHGNGYSLKKGFILDEWATNSKETVDNILMRYAEILISYAEALYEYNGFITNPQLEQTVNRLRNRVGFNVKLTNEFVTTNGLDMLEEIRRERTVEFVDESFRYDDIIRWKIAEKVLPTYLVGAKFVDDETNRQRSDLANRLTDANGMLNGIKVSDEADMYVIEIAGDRRFDPAKDYLYPIPVNEIALSKGNVVQNPNW